MSFSASFRFKIAKGDGRVFLSCKKVRFLLPLVLFLALHFIVMPASVPGQSLLRRDYTRIDETSLSVLEGETGSISSLSDALVAAARDDVDKARAIYTWVVHNIKYDFESLAAGVRHDSAKEVLTRRKGVCQGYSNLFTALAEAVGIEAVTINGTVKRAHPEAEDQGHAWNAVKIGTDWFLLDTTWRRFLSKPQDFIKTYFPRNTDFQFLPNPVSREDFDRQLSAGQGFYDCNMTLIDPPVLDFNRDREAVITFGAPRDVWITAAMGKKSDEKLPGRSVGWDKKWGRKETEPFVFIQRKGETVELHARFPEPGLWYIGVQAGWKGKNGRGAVSINITVDRGYSQCPRFPETHGNITFQDFYIKEPRVRILPAGEKVRFSVESGEAREVAVFVEQKKILLEQEGNTFSGDVPLSPGKITLSAKYQGTNYFRQVLYYEAR